MKINCVIVDDIAENLRSLQNIIEEIDGVEVVKSFTDAKSFKEGINSIVFDMCILDNHLPDGTGIELAKKLRGKKVIFVSAHEISAYDAFDLNAVDVLKKPVSPDRLKLAIKKCRDKIMNEKGYVYIQTFELGKTRFKLDDIIYFKTKKDGKYIVTKQDEKLLTGRKSLEQLMEKLPENRFCIINKGEILNHSYLKAFKEKDLIVIDYLDEDKNYIELTVGDKFINTLNLKIGNDID